MGREAKSERFFGGRRILLIFLGFLIAVGGTFLVSVNIHFASLTAHSVTKGRLYVPFSVVAVSTEPVTDKVAHGYGTIYDSYFTECHAKIPIKLLEIGLGCGMGYGPGASSQIWPKLFPFGEIWFADLNEQCLQTYWNASLPWSYVIGNQSKAGDLERWINETGGNFDFIIDDGGHKNPEQWLSFNHLFPSALKPGGVYFLEDLQVGRHHPYWDGGIPGTNGSVMLDALTEWMDQLVELSMSTEERKIFNPKADKAVNKTYQHELPANIIRIDCVQDMCAITKAAS